MQKMNLKQRKNLNFLSKIFLNNNYKIIINKTIIKIIQFNKTYSKIKIGLNKNRLLLIISTRINTIINILLNTHIFNNKHFIIINYKINKL